MYLASVITAQSRGDRMHLFGGSTYFEQNSPAGKDMKKKLFSVKLLARFNPTNAQSTGIEINSCYTSKLIVYTIIAVPSIIAINRA